MSHMNFYQKKTMKKLSKGVGQMKKILSIILAVLMIATSIPFAFAADHSHGEALFKRAVNDDETAFCTVYEDGCAVVEGEGYADFYNCERWGWQEGYGFIRLETVYIGEGISEIINIKSSMEFVIGENNPYFSTDEDGSLYNKDKTELILFDSNSECYTVASSVKTLKSGCFSGWYISDLIIPDTVETIEPYAFQDCGVGYLELPATLKVIPEFAFYGFSCEGIVIPSTVEKIEDYAFDFGYDSYLFDVNTVMFIMNPECEIGEIGRGMKLLGYSGSTAERYADENGVAFDALDNDDHKHIFLPRVTKESTCTEDGILTYNCPCGNAQPYEGIDKSYGHYMDYDLPDADGNVYCEYCGVMADCRCICHKAERYDASDFEVFIYKIYRFFWKLFRINEECACGNDYHY